MKLLVDMNLSPNWVPLLTEAGFEAVHWTAVGAHDAADATIMEYAAAKGFVVLTHDLDFGALLAASHGRKPSVLQIRAGDVRSQVVGPEVIVALRQTTAELEDGALVTVDPAQTRVRILPLSPRG